MAASCMFYNTIEGWPLGRSFFSRREAPSLRCKKEMAVIFGLKHKKAQKLKFEDNNGLY